MDILILIIFAILMLPGFLGILLPFPSVPYMFAIALIYGFIDKFNHLKTAELIILIVLSLLSLLVDYLSGIIGAKYGGAGKKSVIFGFIGLLLGVILLPPFGGIPGLFLGVWAGEIYSHRDKKQALKAASGSLLGSLAGMIVNVVLALLFMILFILFAKN